MIDTRVVDTVSSKIYQQFPEMSGISPSVRQQTSPKASQGTSADTYLLTFQTNASLAGGKSMPRWVRVTVNSSGKILKISTSR